MKLIDILFENIIKRDYIKSIKDLYPELKVSSKSDDISDIVHFTVKSKDGDLESHFVRLVNNNRLRQIENPEHPEILHKIKAHDVEFSSNKKIKLKNID